MGRVLFPRVAVAMLAGLVGCGAPLGESASDELRIGSGGKGEVISIYDLPLSIAKKSKTAPIKLVATSAFDVEITLESARKLTVVIGGPASASDDQDQADKVYRYRVEPTANPASLTLVIENDSTSSAKGTLSLIAKPATTPPPPGPTPSEIKVPSVKDAIVYSNDYCSYQNKPPYVKSVKWDNTQIKATMRALSQSWRSMHPYYSDRRTAYALESETQTSGLSKTKRDILSAYIALAVRYDSVTLSRLASSSGQSETAIKDLFGDIDGVKDAADNWEAKIRNAKIRNFMRVLCGEYRDYPEMITAKLKAISERQVYAGPNEVKAFDTDKELFSQMTYPAYERMRQVMAAVFSYRTSQRRSACQADPVCAADIDINYNFGDDNHSTNRVSRSVAPWTHCEMKFMFSHYMIDGAPRVQSSGSSETNSSHGAEVYEKYFAAYRGVSVDADLLAFDASGECSAADMAYMYNFRGHNNYKPLWLESNSFIWNSRRANTAADQVGDTSYYLRPFASRYLRARQLLATYLLYPEADHKKFRTASESGGGNILYVTDQDIDGDNLADYKLSDKDGCGDNGVSGSSPSSNCNMISWTDAWRTKTNVERAKDGSLDSAHLASWDPKDFFDADMGFFAATDKGDAAARFERRMARFNQALDRHTNWGPTGYYMLSASKQKTDLPLCADAATGEACESAPDDVRYIGAYSPIVACSYEISKSHYFSTRNFTSTHPYEGSNAKWMFVMRFPTKNYYDEQMLRDGKPMDFHGQYFNETSLSNDYYTENALDRFGWVPPADVHAQMYLVFGAQGDKAELSDIPAP